MSFLLDIASPLLAEIVENKSKLQGAAADTMISGAKIINQTTAKALDLAKTSLITGGLAARGSAYLGKQAFPFDAIPFFFPTPFLLTGIALKKMPPPSEFDFKGLGSVLLQGVLTSIAPMPGAMGALHLLTSYNESYELGKVLGATMFEMGTLLMAGVAARALSRAPKVMTKTFHRIKPKGLKSLQYRLKNSPKALTE